VGTDGHKNIDLIITNNCWTVKTLIRLIALEEKLLYTIGKIFFETVGEKWKSLSRWIDNIMVSMTNSIDGYYHISVHQDRTE
jgi:hypothetical protein